MRLQSMMNESPERIYISSPYSEGDTGMNVAEQLKAAHRIMDMGHCPVTPLLSHFLHIYRQRPYDEWLAVDKELVKLCTILIRLPGKSKGGNDEVETAYDYNVIVCFGWTELTDLLEERGWTV